MVLVAKLKPIPVRYQTFPRTVNPPEFAEKVAKIFRDTTNFNDDSKKRINQR